MPPETDATAGTTGPPNFLPAALAYARAGLRVFPLGVGSKKPLRSRADGGHGVHDATTDEVVISAWWSAQPVANLGIACGPSSDLLVIDVDGPVGRETLATLEREHGPLPRTRRVQSGREDGGEHLWFRWPKGLDAARGKLGPNIDVLGPGRYVVAPPSVHPSGRSYEANDAPVADAPEWLVRTITKEQPLRRSPLRVLGRPSNEVLRRARAYLAKIPGAVSGERGHDATFHVACLLLEGFALSVEEARPLLEEWNETCQPPWSASELEHKLTDAAGQTTNPGYLLGEDRGAAGVPGAVDSPTTGAREAGDPRRERPAKPTIQETAEMHLAVCAAEAALAQIDEPRVYATSRFLVVVAQEGAPPLRGVTRAAGSRFLHRLEAPALREHLSRAASWVRRRRNSGDWRPCLPPGPVVHALLARGSWPLLPYLAGITEGPVLRPDGTILDASGYDPATCLLFDPVGVTFPRVPNAPTADDVRAAVAALREPFEEFEWESPASDLAVVLAHVLTLAGRAGIGGSSPCFAYDSTTRGSGKTLACDVAVILATGRRPPVCFLSSDPEEQRKALFSLAAEGHRAISFDNLTRPFGGGVISAVLTSGEIRDRVLGLHSTATVPFRAVMCATGNNLRYVGDADRRVLVARQRPSVENPEDRQPRGGFRHPDLRAYAASSHARLLTSALTILRAYVVAGRPGHGLAPLGSFEPWDALVRGCCLWSDIGDPLACRERVRADCDEDRERLGALLTGWQAAFGGSAATVADAVERAKTSPVLRAALAGFDTRGDAEHPNQGSIGIRVKQVVGRIVGGRRLETVGNGSPRAYRVGFVGFVGFDTADTNTRARVEQAAGTTPSNLETPTAAEPPGGLPARNREPGEEG